MTERGAKWWRKMQLSDIKWRGASGSLLAMCLFLGVSTDDAGWKFALDIILAIWWAWICARFLMLSVIEIRKPVGSITINGEEIWP